MSAPSLAIRDAATVILWREGRNGPQVLLGQRGAKAAFMPNKFVFPGGAVDAEDSLIDLGGSLQTASEARLRALPRTDQASPNAIAAAAIRELFEEAGLMLGDSRPWQAPPAAGTSWHSIAERGLAPMATGMDYIFRAITPPGRPRRFDARFFLIPATQILGDLDDFSQATDELSHLQWVNLGAARDMNLPFITEVVLAEVAQLIGDKGPPPSVPFFDNSSDRPTFRRIP